MEGIGDGVIEAAGGDLMKKLDDDTAIHVLHYLDSTRDIANASGVCRSWRRFGPFLLFLDFRHVGSSAIHFLFLKL
jgi:hypothetical protein